MFILNILFLKIQHTPKCFRAPRFRIIFNHLEIDAGRVLATAYSNLSIIQRFNGTPVTLHKAVELGIKPYLLVLIKFSFTDHDNGRDYG